MPRAPRSWTANSSSSSQHVLAAVGRRTPSRRRSTTRSAARGTTSARPSAARRARRRCAPTPLGWRCTIVAPIDSASTTRSRSEPAGRSNTAHSSSPLTPPDQPAGQPVGEQAGAGQRHRLDRPAGHEQPGAGLPLRRRRGRLDDRPDARHPPLVDVRAQGVVDLGDDEAAPLARRRRSAARPRRAPRPAGAAAARSPRPARCSPQPPADPIEERRLLGVGRGVDAVQGDPAWCGPAGGTRRAACASSSACRPRPPAR